MNYELKVLERQAVEAARLARKMSRSLRSKIDTKSSTNRLKGLDNLTAEWMVWDQDRISLRKSLRYMHLARAYLSGKPYLQVENKCKTMPIEWEVWNIIEDYQGGVSRQDVERWLYEAD